VKFLLDESADFRLLKHLTDNGHDVTAISRAYPQSLSDMEVLNIAVQEQRILITRDRDFGELIFRQQQPHHGVILFRLGVAKLAETTRWMEHMIHQHRGSMHHFLVVTDSGLRIRQVTLD
jgi:predicted nuclease of predicted toxin-antitoxin system